MLNISFFMSFHISKMCFTCLDSHDQAIGWFQGPVRQYVRERKTRNELVNYFTLIDCEKKPSECKIVYTRKEDEIKMPARGQGQYFLLIAEFALFELEDSVIYFPLRPIEPCDKPEFPKVRLFEINQAIAENYLLEKKLLATDGSTYVPELEPETDQLDELAHMVEHYLKYFLSGGEVPKRRLY